MTSISSANPCWPPPPLGRSRHRARFGTPIIEAAVDEVPTGPTPRWFEHPLITIAAFLIFPPLGLRFAIRYHGLWRKRIGIRPTALAVTIAFVIIPFVSDPGDDSQSAVQDGAPIVSSVEQGPPDDGATAEPRPA
jgi:hypothetical protein